MMICFEYLKQKLHLMEQFRVIKELGEGGYGKAFLVESLKNHKLRVVKKMMINDLRNDQIENIKNEANILKSMKHSNIIRYRGCKINNKFAYILMDYANGGDLSLYIKKQETNIPEELIIDIFTQLCLGLKYIHDRKIIHRDIKPSNIFISENGIVKIGDFGLSKVLQSTLEILKTPIGSPYYLSPEICKGELYNNKSDIWSLGCILHELCTLRKTFNGKCLRTVMRSIITTSPQEIPSLYSQEIRYLISIMLNKNQQNRPSLNDILSLPIIRAKAIALIGNSEYLNEVSHTVFHGEKPLSTPEPYNEEIVILNENYNSSKEEKFEFMGRTLVLQKNFPSQSKAESIKSFIIDIVGNDRFDELYSMAANQDPISLAKSVTNNLDNWILNLLFQLIVFEEN